MPDSQVKTVGIIGGGQLAWMMGAAARKLNLALAIQTPSAEDPAVKIADRAIFAPIDDAAATARLAADCDVITFENEFIDIEALRALETSGTVFRPSLSAIAPLLDKYDQRTYLQSLGLPVPEFCSIAADSPEPRAPRSGSLRDRFPVVLKARRHGYDGYGTFIVKSQAEFTKIWERSQAPSLLLEEFIPFEKELAIVVARNPTGEIARYPVVETQQEQEVCRRVLVPAAIPEEIREEIGAIGDRLLTQLNIVGLIAIEFFLSNDGKLYVNEIAPRTHNSGHYSLDACNLSQFEMHLRAVAGLPLPEPQLLNNREAVMVNLLGYEHSRDDYAEKRAQIAALPGARLHWYGKTESRPGRKLGHVTVLLSPGDSAAEVARQVETLWEACPEV